MDYQEILLTVLQTLITALVPYMMVLITSAISKCSKKLQEKTQGETIDRYIGIAEQILHSIVTDVGENYVKQMKAQDKFTTEAQAEAFNMAKETFLNTISEETKSIISEAIVDLDAWIQSNIETYVADDKIY